MAVNSITFGGVNSADFGIYISGEGVFNAPKRDVEMIAIPGRNGELALDKGRFENIEVTYPAFNFEPNDYETFAKNLSDFRNAICSLRGYQHLTDTFHPDEYRMAAYIGGLEIKPIKYNTASEFSIIFDCKPQRYLTDGETPITLGEWGEVETASGDIVEIDNLGIEAVKSLSVELEPIQSGSGTPSPDNVRPISGRTECDVYVSPTTSETDAEVYTTTLGRTVYGGTLDVVSGELVVDRWIKSFTWGDISGTVLGNYERKGFALGFDNVYPPNANRPQLSNVAPYMASFGDDSLHFYVNGNTALFFLPTDTPSETVVQVTGELPTPQTYQLTGQDVELIEGNNYIWSDSGNVTVEHGQNPNYLINPTRFESSPLLMVEGYGTIRFNGYQVIVNNAIVGDVQLSPAITDKWTRSNVNYDGSLLNQGDPITVHGNRVVKFEARLTDTSYTVTRQSLVRTTANITGNFSYTASKVGDGYNFELTYEGNDTFSYGYEGQTNDYFTLELTRTKNGVTSSVTRTIQVSFVANTTYIRFIVPASSSADGITFTGLGTYSTGEITAVSTQYVLGHPTYVDCDYGEAYKIVDGRIVSLNKYIDLGSDLPKLGVGQNEVTVDDTITELQIVPRWWRI